MYCKEKNKFNIGDTITLTVHRNSEDIQLQLTLGESPTKQETTNQEIEDSLLNKNNASKNQDFSGSIFDFFN